MESTDNNSKHIKFNLFDIGILTLLVPTIKATAILLCKTIVYIGGSY